MKSSLLVKFRVLALAFALAGAAGSQISVVSAAEANAQKVQSTVNSEAFRKAFVGIVYQKFLGRAATAAEAAPLITQLKSGGKSWVTVVTTVAGSPAYFKKSGSNNSAFVTRLFQDLVGRAPDPTEELGAGIDFLKGGGTPTQLAEVVADTDAFRANWTQIFYQKLFGREATEDEVKAASTTLSESGLAPMVASLLASAEFFELNGGSQSGWQTAVNQSLLGDPTIPPMGGGTDTPPAPNPVDTTPTDTTPTETTVPGEMPGNGNNGRAPMVQALLSSPEYLNALVQRQYQKYLDRPATNAELQQWSGSTSDQIIMGILTSDEYFKHAGGTTNAYLNQLSLDLLGKPGSGKTGGGSGKNKKGPSAEDLLNILRNLPIKNR